MLPHPERFFRAGERVAVAVSGGADSVALLELLLESRDRLGIVVSVAHFNHRLRGTESDGDAKFVAGLAARHGIACFEDAATELHAKNVESQAREDRYTFFARLVADRRVDKIATAHTADDQAETVLGRFLRGGGTAGTSGILAVRDGCGGAKIVRPLLEVRRAALRSWAESQSLAWREDSSNSDRRFLRNRLRHDLIPLLEREYNPGLVAVLGRAAEIARAEEEFWQRHIEELAARLLAPSGKEWKLSIADFVQLDEAQQRRLLRAVLARAKGDLQRVDFEHIEAVRRLALDPPSGGRPTRRVLELPGCAVERQGDFLMMRATESGYNDKLGN